MSGALLVLLGLWGGLAPLIGPYFGDAFGSHATWHLTLNRVWLDVLPGAAVLLGGLMLMGSGHRVSGTAASWLAMLGGAWFAIGPAVSRLWEHGPGPIGAPLFGHVRQTLELIGSFYGLGVVVVAVAAVALGRVLTRPALVVAPSQAYAPVQAEPAAEEAPAPAVVEHDPEPAAAEEAPEPVPAGVTYSDGSAASRRIRATSTSAS